MAVVLTEGFDMYNGSGAGSGLQARWTYQSGNNGVAMVGGRFGGQAMRVQSAGVFSTVQYTLFLPAAYSALSIGFAYWPRTLTNASNRFNLLDSAGGTLTVQVDHNNSTGSLDVRNAAGAIVANSGPGTIANNAAWVYVELEIVTGNPTGQIRAYLNNTQFANLTGQNCGANPVQGIMVRSTIDGGGNSDTVHIYDDMYVVDVATRLGERRIETLRGAADVTKLWTPNSGTANFSRTNETVVDGDTSYVSTTGINNRDLYTIAPLSSTPLQIDAVNVVSFPVRMDAAARTIANSVQSAGVDSDGAALNVLSSYRRLDRLMLTDPATAAAWAAAGVNALRIGPKLLT